MWTAVKIAAAVSAVLLTLVFIGLLVMVTRPALLTGVSGTSLALSLSGGDGSGVGGACSKRPDGDWNCSVSGRNANGAYLVDVDWMGCWTAVPRPGPGSSQREKGCIELSDIINLD